MRVIRLMSPKHLGREGFAICSGYVGSPKQRCLWRVVGYRKHATAADKALQALPAENGRAIILLDYPHLKLINRKGEVIQDNAAK